MSNKDGSQARTSSRPSYSQRHSMLRHLGIEFDLQPSSEARDRKRSRLSLSSGSGAMQSKDGLHSSGTPKRQNIESEKREDEPTFVSGRRQSDNALQGIRVDGLMAHAAILHSPSASQHMGDRSMAEDGAQENGTPSKRSGLARDTPVMKNFDGFDSLKGATTAYEQMNHSGGGFAKVGSLRHPAAIMPDVHSFFFHRSRLLLDEDNSPRNVRDGGRLYDPFSLNSSPSIVGKSKGNAGLGDVSRYNNTVLYRRAVAPGSESLPMEKKENEGITAAASVEHTGSLTPSRQHVSHSVAMSPHSSPSLQPPLSLNSYLSEQLCDILHRSGIPENMYEWQAKCLTVDEGILSNQKNLVVSAPTSGGKTLIAEILMLRAVANDPCRRKVLFILPYVSLCDEKAAKLSKLLSPMGRELKRAYGSEYSESLFSPETGIIVCTPENANSIINRMLDAHIDLSDEICCVVVDELHLVGSSDRGALLEIVISKLRYHCGSHRDSKKAASIGSGSLSPPTLEKTLATWTPSMIDPRKVQLVGLTATCPNIQDIGAWLDAITFVSEFRPVPLTEYLIEGEELKKKNLDGSLTTDRSLPPAELGDGDHVGFLTKEAVDMDRSVLVFCATKRRCLEEASRLAKYFSAHSSISEVQPEIKSFRSDLSSTLLSQQFQYSKQLASFVTSGIAFHHSDLSMKERKLIEDAFRAGYLKVLCATGTLGTGVNLPIFRVIFKDVHHGEFKHKNFLAPASYRQVSGRAGRTGIDTHGESILIHRKMNNSKRLGRSPPLEYLQKLLIGELDQVHSSILESGNSRRMDRLMLEMVSTSESVSEEDVRLILKSTFIGSLSTQQQEKLDELYCSAIKSLDYLASVNQSDPVKSRGRKVSSVDRQPLILKQIAAGMDKIAYGPSDMGKAVVVSGMSPDEALNYLEDLKIALNEGLIMSSDLHACFLCVPINFAGNYHLGRDEYGILYSKVTNLERSENQVIARVKVSIPFIREMGVGQGYNSTIMSKRSDLQNQNRLCTRLYIAFFLQELIQEIPLIDCMNRYLIKSGRIVEEIRDDVSRFAAKGSALCERLEWHLLAGTLKTFGSRVWFGARQEIISLASICRINPKDARILFEGGLERPQDIVSHSAADIHAILLTSAQANAQLGDSTAQKYQTLAAHILESCKIYLTEGSGEFLSRGLTSNRSSPSKFSPVKPPKHQEQQTSRANIPQQNQKKNETPESASVLKKYSKIFEVIESGAHVGIYLSVENEKKNSVDKQQNARMPAAPSKRQKKSPTGEDKNATHESTVRGIAVSWEGGHDYIRFHGKDDRTRDAIAQHLSSSLAMRGKFHKDALIASFKWKDISLKLDQLLSKYMNASVKTALLRVVDVRLGAWMLDPDAAVVADGLSHFSRYAKTSKRAKISLGVSTNITIAYQHCRDVHEYVCSQQMKEKYSQIGPDLHFQTDSSTPVVLQISVMSLAILVKILPPLVSSKLLDPLLRMDMPICRILGAMEERGIGVDVEMLNSQYGTLVKWKALVSTAAAEMFGKRFNLNSPADVQRVLFTELRLKPPGSAYRKRKDGKTTLSVDKRVLNDLKDIHPIIPLILQYRKLVDTMEYITPLLGFATSSGGSTLAIHANFLQTSAGTGRLAMEEPSLQCLPKPFIFEFEDIHAEVNLRNAIVPKFANRVMVSADFRHIELRVMAHLSRDKSMIDLFQKKESDPFKLLACKWLKVEDEDSVTDSQRQQVKQLTYGLLYGMGEKRLGENLDVSAAKAKSLKQEFLESFPDLGVWIERIVHDCKETGRIVTLLGRYRWMENINSQDPSKRAADERAAVNSVCQGSAADIAKMAMVKIEENLHAKYNGNPPCASVLQIHDELLFEVDQDSLHDVVDTIKVSMEGACELLVPLPVKFRIGRSWGEALHEI